MPPRKPTQRAISRGDDKTNGFPEPQDIRHLLVPGCAAEFPDLAEALANLLPRLSLPLVRLVTSFLLWDSARKDAQPSQLFQFECVCAVSDDEPQVAVAIDCSSDGQICITDTQQLLVFSPNGKKLRESSGVCHGGRAVAVDGRHVLVLYASLPQIFVYRLADAKLVKRLDKTHLKCPLHMAVNGKGFIYVCDGSALALLLV